MKQTEHDHGTQADENGRASAESIAEIARILRERREPAPGPQPGTKDDRPAANRQRHAA